MSTMTIMVMVRNMEVVSGKCKAVVMCCLLNDMHRMNYWIFNK
jgi:hypothetical protein